MKKAFLGASMVSMAILAACGDSDSGTSTAASEPLPEGIVGKPSKFSPREATTAAKTANGLKSAGTRTSRLPLAAPAATTPSVPVRRPSSTKTTSLSPPRAPRPSMTKVLLLNLTKNPAPAKKKAVPLNSTKIPAPAKRIAPPPNLTKIPAPAKKKAPLLKLKKNPAPAKRKVPPLRLKKIQLQVPLKVPLPKKTTNFKFLFRQSLDRHVP